MKDRYQDAETLADDVEKHLADEPINAFQEPIVMVGRRWVRKHPAFVASTAAVLVGVGGIGLSVRRKVQRSKTA